MIEFLQSYGIWIVLGIGLVAMLVLNARRGAAGGCGMAGHQHDDSSAQGEEKKDGQQKHSGCC